MTPPGMASRGAPGPPLLAHHRAAISAAVVLADATTISLAAPAMSFKLTMGTSPPCGTALDNMCVNVSECVTVCVLVSCENE